MHATPNLPTEIIPTKIRRLELSGRFPVDMRVPPLEIKIQLESNPLKSRILVRRLAVCDIHAARGAQIARSRECCNVCLACAVSQRPEHW